MSMTYKEAINAIKNNYPPENYTILREALKLAIKVLEEKSESEATHGKSCSCWECKMV